MGLTKGKYILYAGLDKTIQRLRDLQAKAELKAKELEKQGRRSASMDENVRRNAYVNCIGLLYSIPTHEDT